MPGGEWPGDDDVELDDPDVPLGNLPPTGEDPGGIARLAAIVLITTALLAAALEWTRRYALRGR